MGRAGGPAPERAQRRLRARSGADLRRDRGVAQHARGLVVVARGRRHVDAQQQLAPAVQHVAEQVGHLPRPRRGRCGGHARAHQAQRLQALARCNNGEADSLACRGSLPWEARRPETAPGGHVLID